MDTLLKQIEDKLKSLGFKSDDSKEWVKTETKLFGGGTVYVNGKATENPGQKAEVKSVWTNHGECIITDTTTKQVDTSLMCSFQTYIDNTPREDLEINLYPSEFQLFMKFLGTIFRMN